jgi:anaerobic magnesium-protoporphyrin IX monomethyl ester cyclase
MTKVLLIEPPKAVWDLMGDCVAPPLGLAQVAALLEREPGITVDIVDCNGSGLSWSQLERAIVEAQPDVVGATALTPYFPPAVRAMRLAKGVKPAVVTVLGGPHVTFCAGETLTQHPEVDFIVRGEGDYTLVNLVRCLEEGGDLALVQGIAFRRDGQVVQTSQPPPVDVKALPFPAYHLLPMHAYHFEMLVDFATLLASRGCSHRCTFCSEWPFWGDGWRPRDPEAVVEEMELLHRRYGRRSLWFGDDCFNVDGDHMRVICEGILERGLEVAWFYQGRADLVIKHKDLLPLMRRAGNLMVQIGIESSTDEELQGFRKRLTTDQVKEAVDLLKQNDIVSQGLIIVGTPKETARSIEHKLRFAKWLDVDFPIFTAFTPFPGTAVYERARAEGLLEDPPDWAKYDMAHFLMLPERMSRKELLSWYHWCYWSYYLDPIKLARGLFARGRWKRHIWRHMTRFNFKKTIEAWLG